MVAANPLYRNNRPNYYQEKSADTVSVGSIINVFKTKASKRSYDSQFVPATNPVNGVTAYTNISGNAQPQNNPEYQYRGYLYCDGSEYNIRDYPLLYAAIGNQYGGTSGLGVTVINQGSGYAANTTVTFSAAPTGGVTATAIPTISSGKITAINIVKSGAGYTTAPTITLSNTGGGSNATFYVRIDSAGSISGIAPENVFQFWPEEYMGTFCVPDLLAKKIVGFGPVYGSGSPTIGNIEMTVGPNSIGGYWYFSKDTQKGYFNIGQVKTINYTNVIGTITGKLIGSQVVTVTLNDNDLPGVPAHDHVLLHSEAPAVAGFNPGGFIDPYLTGYRNKNGKILNFIPSGGVKLTHSHALSKKQIPGLGVATYDLYNFRGGDTGPGSIKPNGNYWASGASGQFVDVTFTPPSIFKPFGSGSTIGGIDVITNGNPIYQTVNYTYTSPGSYTVSFASDIEQISFTLHGGGGSGGVWKTAGNDGSSSTLQLGDGTAFTATAGGGSKGTAASEDTGGVAPYSEGSGSGGSGGACNVIGTELANVNYTVSTGNSVGFPGNSGETGKLWKVAYPSGPQLVGDGLDPWEGAGGGALLVYGKGSNGKYIFVTGTSNGNTVTATYLGGTASFTPISSDITKYSVSKAYIELFGASGLAPSSYQFGCTTGQPGPGKRFKLSILATKLGSTFILAPGQVGQPRAGQAATTFGVGTGGLGGAGYASNGGGGGAATVVAVGSTIVAGAGGGGGGGGTGEGQCGDNAFGNTFTDGVQDVGSQSLFSGGGGTGGDYGCTGGGGGGGGGGVGLTTQTGGGVGGEAAGGQGGPGGGGGGSGGHGGGYGGMRGLSSFRSDYFSLVSSGDSSESNGKIVANTEEDRSYYTSAAGGGGAGGQVVGQITKAALTNSGASGLTISVGAGGAAVSMAVGGGSTTTRTISSVTNWVDTSGIISSSPGGDGAAIVNVQKLLGYAGGTVTTTVGDIVVKASPGIELYSSGSGVGTAGGFKLPTTQIPIVQITPQGSQGGSGATATCTVSGGVVTGVTLGDGGSGYTSAPNIRFLHGSGSGTTATATLTGNIVTGITFIGGSSTAYTRYVKFGGSDLERYIVIAGEDCTAVERFGVKCARGNNINGGERPDDSSDELLLYYNTDGSLNFPDSQFIGVLVPRPSDTDITNNYDGDGTGNDATLWYTYYLNLPEGAQKPGVRFKIVQKRNTANGSNDNGGNSDHYGICDFIYDKKFISQIEFQSSAGELSKDAQTLTYTVEGNLNSAYPAGIEVNDMTFNLTAGVPLTPTPALDPVREIPLIEPYALTKYLIKAY
jgi:hypothetical protein